MSDITHILAKIESGDPLAAEQLLPLVYDELRSLAAAKLCTRNRVRRCRRRHSCRRGVPAFDRSDRAAAVGQSRYISLPLRLKRCGGS